MRVIISYDISDTKRRNKIAKILEGHGYRVQYSVFECDLDRKKLAALQKRLKPLVKVSEWESIRIYPLDAASAQKVEVIGKDMARFLQPTIVI